MCSVGTDEVARTHRLLAVIAGQAGAHAVGILLESGEPKTPLDAHPACGELLTQNPLSRVLRNRYETERHVGRQCHVELRSFLTVDVDDLAAHLDGCIKDAAQHSDALEHLECSRLHANGFRILRRLEQRVHDAAVDAAPGQFDRGGQPDRPCSGDEHLGLGGVGHG